MKDFTYPIHPTGLGYMTEKTRRDYIASAVAKNLLPANAHRVPEIVSLDASQNSTKPIQFWQLYSVFGQNPIVRIVENFYERVFSDEDWFTSVFERVGGVGHHINTQASMWIDVMGGGPYYHGAEFRLNFHHTHNALQLMNDKGAQRWSQLMLDTLEASTADMTDDPRVRTSINTFLSYFMGKYSDDFGFENRSFFGATNPPFKQRVNFLKMSQKAIEALTESEIRDALKELGVDASSYVNKEELVAKALMI
tara:strand:- start:31153 stop:31908 length:756 start_codon:yes stop_codon:yes gene_type:complete